MTITITSFNTLMSYIKPVFSITALSFASMQVHASSYQHVYDVVFNQAHENAQTNDQQQAQIQQEQAVYHSGQLPAYEVTARKFTKAYKDKLAIRTQQTLIDKLDYYDRLEKLVHSNGICMAGTWYMTEDVKNKQNQSYTGMFANGSSSLFIGRLSTALSNTKQNKPLSIGLAGKIFGTNDVTKEVTTSSFFVADNLTGVKRDSVFDFPMTNKPKISIRFSLIGLGIKIAPLFSKADKNAGMRPVSDIAKMGLADKAQAISPKYMMVLPVKPVDHTNVNNSDFRDEFALSDTELTEKTPRHFIVYVSDTASKPEDDGWQHIGFIKANETIVSYGCDRQLHFAHPKVEDK